MVRLQGAGIRGIVPTFLFSPMFPRLFSFPAAVVLALLCLSSCATDQRHFVEVSVPQQRMAVYRDGALVREYPISTSKFGLGDERGSYKTPLGNFTIERKIGKEAPPGTVFKSRRRTGEILPPNAPGRDPIVSRIIWLKGNEPHNANAYKRLIYIHGTPEERTIGSPTSFGCVRMRSADIIDLFDIVGKGARVYIGNHPLRGSAAPGVVPGPVQ